jgi:Large polyvalent protein associated domain 22/ADP-Ribosyltransferase in polyvalent proteins
VAETRYNPYATAPANDWQEEDELPQPNLYTPDEIGRARDIAKRMNLSPDEVLRDDILMTRGDEVTQFQQAPPRTRRWLSNPQNADVARDDAKNLARIESMFPQGMPFRREVSQGIFNYLDWGRKVGPTLGSILTDSDGAVASYRVGMESAEILEQSHLLARETRTGQDVYSKKNSELWAESERQRTLLRARGLTNPIARDVIESTHSSLAGFGAMIGGPAIEAWRGWTGGDDATSLAARQLRERARGRLINGEGSVSDVIDFAIGTGGGVVAGAIPLMSGYGGMATVGRARVAAPSIHSVEYSYRMESGAAFEQYLREGFEPKLAAELAHKAGMASAAIEQVGGMSAFVRSPMRSVSRDAIKDMTRREIVKRFAGKVVRQAGTEGLFEETSQDLVKSWYQAQGVEIMRSVYGEDRGAFDWQKAWGSAAYSGFIGMFIGGGMGAAYGAPTLVSELRQSDQVMETQRAIERLSEVARESATMKRDPEAGADAIDNVMGQSGNVLVSVDGLEEVARKNNMNFDEFVSALGIDAEATSAARGRTEAADKMSGFISMSPGDYAAKIGRTSFGTAVAQHVTTDPNVNTPAQQEIVRVQAEKMLDEFKEGLAKGDEDIDRIRADMQDSEKILKDDDAELAAVLQDVLTDLNALESGRRFSKQQNEQLKEIFRGIRAIQVMSAARPEDRPSIAEVWNQHRVRIISELTDTRVGYQKDWNRSAERVPTSPEIMERRGIIAREYADIADSSGNANSSEAADALAHAIAADKLGFPMKDRIDQLKDLPRSYKETAEARARALIKRAEKRALTPSSMNPSAASEARTMKQAQAHGYQGEDRGEAAEWLAALRKYGPEGMTKEARLARAAKLGYLSEVLYHGTNQPVTIFDLSVGGMNTNSPSSPMGVWFSDNPEVAAAYAEYAGRRLVFDQKNHNRLVAEAKRKADAAEKAAGKTGDWDAYEKAIIEWENLEAGAAQADDITGQNVVPVRVRLANPLVIDFEGGRPQEPDFSARVLEAKQAGHDGVIFKNMLDGGPVATHYVVFDPTNIRSINAAFNEDYDGDNILGQFVGIMSGLSDEEHEALNEAQRMFADGATEDQIWEKTGWHKFGPKPDDWQMEIDTSSMKLNLDKIMESLGKKNSTELMELREVMDFPEIYRRYPQLGRVLIKFTRNSGQNGAGSFNMLAEQYRDASGGLQVRSSITANFSSKLPGNFNTVIRETVVHEVQHAIQVIEGWSRGSNTVEARKRNPVLYDRLVKENVKTLTEKNVADFLKVVSLGKVVYADDGVTKVLDEAGNPKTIPYTEEERTQAEASFRRSIKTWTQHLAETKAALQVYMHNRGEIQARIAASRSKTPMSVLAELVPGLVDLLGENINEADIWAGDQRAPFPRIVSSRLTKGPRPVDIELREGMSIAMGDLEVEAAIADMREEVEPVTEDPTSYDVVAASGLDPSSIPTLPTGDMTMGQSRHANGPRARLMRAMEENGYTDKDIILAYVDALETGTWAPNVSAATDLELEVPAFQNYIGSLRSVMREKLKLSTALEVSAEYGVDQATFTRFLQAQPPKTPPRWYDDSAYKPGGGMRPRGPQADGRDLDDVGDFTMGQSGRGAPPTPAVGRPPPSPRAVQIERQNAAVLAHAIREAGMCASGAAVSPAMAAIIGGNGVAAVGLLPISMFMVNPWLRDAAIARGEWDTISTVSPQENLRRLRQGWERLPPDEVRFPAVAPNAADGDPSMLGMELMPVDPWTGAPRMPSQDRRFDRREGVEDFGDGGAQGFAVRPAGVKRELTPLIPPADAPPGSFDADGNILPEE